MPKSPKSPKPRFWLYMAIWPDPAHGTCSYGYFKISFWTFRKVNIFEKVENLDYTLLEIYFFAGFRVSQQGASVSELPAALRRPRKKNTPLDFGTCILWIL